MTNGSAGFLRDLKINYPQIDFYFMQKDQNTIAYYENEQENIFDSGRSYQVVIGTGHLQTTGYVVMNHIPVIEDEQASFEGRFKQNQNEIQTTPGFIGFRLLKPDKGNTYIAYTQWQSQQDFTNWKNSAQFKNSHQNNQTTPPAYFADKPFITTYEMIADL